MKNLIINQELLDNNISLKEVVNLWRYFNRQEYYDRHDRIGQTKTNKNIVNLILKYLIIHDREFIDAHNLTCGNYKESYIYLIDLYNMCFDSADIDCYLSHFTSNCSVNYYNFCHFVRQIINSESKKNYLQKRQARKLRISKKIVIKN